MRTGTETLGSFYLGLSWSYRSGAATTPVEDIVVDGSGTAFGVEGPAGSARLPAFHRLDVRVEYPFANSWGEWRAYLEVMNLYNRSNVFQASYDETYSQRSDYKMLPILPIAGISLDF